MLAVGAVAMSIDDDVKLKAKQKLIDFFGADAARNQDVIDVDAHISKDEGVAIPLKK
jgi:hypothetical protein